MAVAGIATMALVLVGSFQLVEVPAIAGSTYEAAFTEAGGLESGAPVLVAGQEVGEVQSVDLESPLVTVSFTAKDVTFGRDTKASITTTTLLGGRGLKIEPRGDGQMGSGDTIPVERTEAPYSVSEGLEDLTGETSQIDTQKVKEALNTFSDTFEQTPEEITPALEGITRLSRTLNSRDEALESLLRRANNVSGVLKEHTDELTKLIIDGNALLGELQARREALRDLLVNTSRAADQVSGLVEDQGGRLKPALTELRHTVDILNRNEGNIVSAVERVSSFIVGLGEGLGSGPWFSGAADVAGTGTAIFPTHEFVPSLAVPTEPAPPGSIPTLPSVPGLLGVGGNG